MKHPRILYTVILFGLAQGCGVDKLEEMRSYAEEVKARPVAPIEPLPVVKTYDSFTYEDADLRDPFTPSRLSTAASGGGLSPDPNRAREPLEGYPLDSLRMVGTLARDGREWSLIMDTGGTVHRIQEGNYLGQNDGKIIAITEQGTDLIEIIDDGQGAWIERPASLTLSEPTEGVAKK